MISIYILIFILFFLNLYTLYKLGNNKRTIEKIMDFKKEELSELLIKAENLIEEFNLVADIILTKMDEKISKCEGILYDSSDNTKDIKKEEINENMTKLESKKIMIQNLYEKGSSLEEIAKKLNVGIGEVQLILNLKNMD